jgi:hypothetical protein
VKVRLLLAHAAEIQAGMLYAMGIGWTEIGPDPSPFAVAALIEVGWDETNRPHELVVGIVDVDGQPLTVVTPTGDQPFQINASFTTGRPPNAKPGRSFMVPVALNLPPIPLQPARDYIVRASVNGTVLDETPFSTRPAQPQQPRP